MQIPILRAAGIVGAVLLVVNGATFAAHPGVAADGTQQVQLAAHVGPDLKMPIMDPERGKTLFASKGCVVCHSINGVGGTDAPNLDASTMEPKMNPFEFFAKMWRGAEAMIMMQNEELGQQIEFTGQDLADIVAFAHDAEVQKTFSENDIPESLKDMMEEGKDH